MTTINALMTGVTILAQYSVKDAKCLSAGKNKLWVGPHASLVSLEDTARLELLGWLIDESNQQWCLYI